MVKMGIAVNFEAPRIARWIFLASVAFSACENERAAGSAVAPVQPLAGASATPTAAGGAAGATVVTGAAVPPASAPATASPAAPSGPVSPANPAAVSGAAGSAAAPLAGAPAPAPAMPTETVTITAPQVAPGTEDTACVQIRLSNSAPMSIVKLHNRLSAGSHHFILTALDDPQSPEQALTRCAGFSASILGAPLTITQAHDDHVQLPEGIGYRLQAGQVMHLEMHYINTTERPIDISATSDLFAAEPGAALEEAAVMLIGTADIAVPPHSMMETPEKFLQLPAGMDDVKFYAITGHTHRYGTSVDVSLANAQMQPVAELYAPANFDWEAPESKLLTPHVSVPPNGGFLLKCGWNNTGDTELKWGESALQEMCFFWGYYYPRKDVFSIVVDDIDQETLKTVVARPPPPPP